MPRLSRRAIRAIVVVVAVVALLAVGAMLRRNQPLPETPQTATVQVK
jgi:hypothetical protein